MNTPQVIVYGIWYRDDGTYLRFKKVCADQENFPDGYSGWLRRAEAMVAQFKKEGRDMRKVYCEADSFIAWCKINACTPDAAARGRYACVKGDEDARSDN